MPLTNRTKAEVLLVLITFVWGTTFVVVKEALTDASPLPFLALRFTLAGALLFFLLGRGRTDRKALPAGAALGLFLFGGFFFQTLGQVYTTPSKCAFITGFSVVLVPIIMLFRGARLRRHRPRPGTCPAPRVGSPAAPVLRRGSSWAGGFVRDTRATCHPGRRSTAAGAGALALPGPRASPLRWDRRFAFSRSGP